MARMAHKVRFSERLIKCDSVRDRPKCVACGNPIEEGQPYCSLTRGPEAGRYIHEDEAHTSVAGYRVSWGANMDVMCRTWAEVETTIGQVVGVPEDDGFECRITCHTMTLYEWHNLPDL